MKDKLIEYKDVIISNSIYDGAKLIIGLLTGGGITGYAANAVAAYNQIPVQYRKWIAILVVIVFTLGYLELLSRLSNSKPRFPSMVCDYEILRKNMRLEYGKGACKYLLEIKLKSKKNNLDRYYGKYTWSGSGKALLKCTNRKYSLIELVRKDAYIEYEVLFNRTYRRGEVFSFVIEGTMPDPAYSFVPFLSTQVVVPTAKLNIHILIPPVYGVREIICESMAATRKNDEMSKTISLDDEGQAHWEINNPKLLYIYVMRWQLP